MVRPVETGRIAGASAAAGPGCPAGAHRRARGDEFVVSEVEKGCSLLAKMITDHVNSRRG